jgi:alpha-mannosidase
MLSGRINLMRSSLPYRFVYLVAISFLFILVGRTACAETQLDRVVKTLGAQATVFKVELPKWKVKLREDPRCLDPNFVPDKSWKSASIGYGFPQGGEGAWFWTKYKIPENINGKPVAGSKVELYSGIVLAHDIWINGKWVQDITEDRNSALVTMNAQPGEEYSILLKGRSIRSAGVLFKAYLTFSAIDKASQEANRYLTDVQVVQALKESSPDTGKWSDILERSATLVDLDAWSKQDDMRFVGSIIAARKELEPASELAIKQKVFLLGYSHIDLAWLWDKEEGEKVWYDTTRTVFDLFKEYPEWIFCSGQAAGYDWMERDHPDAFAKIKERVADGRWEIVGGTWVEYDSNLPGGESYVRQLLYGKRYFRKMFGKDIKIAWTPDSFGYNWNLAQIYKKAGITGFLTQKLRSNDTTQFPYHIFWWEGPDGSRLLTYFPVGGYAESLDTSLVLKNLEEVKKNIGVPETLEIYGIGDHGGGVTRTHLNRAEAFINDQVFPTTKYSSANSYFAHLNKLSKTINFPVYRDELYLEHHRGTYTSQASTKLNNRRGEIALTNTETFSSIASRLGYKYPKDDIRSAWNILMFNQFHDILPGSSINKVYKDTEEDYAQMFVKTGSALDGALKTIAGQVKTNGPGKALLLFNSAAWSRDDVVTVDADTAVGSTVLDAAGKPVPSQVVGADNNKLLFVARKAPGMGYTTYRIIPGAKNKITPLKASPKMLENEFFRVVVDSKTGNITSLIDKRFKREYFGGGLQGNMLQCYRDKHPADDAWNIQLHEELPVALASAPELIESGPVRATLRWTKTIGQSTFVQYLSVVAGVPEVFGRIEVDWNEAHVMAKLAFQLNLKSDNAWYEIPFAAISRPAVAKNDAERAKWEVSAQKWVEYPNSDGKAGFLLLNNSKYGYDAKNNVLRMSLLRSPKYPDPEADMRHHTIEYAIVPHAGDWRTAEAPRLGFNFNAPLIPLYEALHTGSLPSHMSFFTSEPSNVILHVVKKAEDSKSFILRVYEATGKDSKAKIILPAKPKSVEETNLLEEQIKKIAVTGNTFSATIGHYEIKTFRVTF